MEEDEQENNSSSHQNDNSPRLLWTGVLVPHPQPKAIENDPEAKETKNVETSGGQRTPVDKQPLGWDRIVELCLSGAIFIASAVQLYTVITNNKQTGYQTDRIISASQFGAYASKQNAQAANSFASSAKDIKEGIESAVDKLAVQDRIAQESLDINIANFQADRLPILEVLPDRPDFPSPCDHTRNCTRIHYKNAGRTIALSVQFSGFVIFGFATPEIINTCGHIDPFKDSGQIVPLEINEPAEVYTPFNPHGIRCGDLFRNGNTDFSVYGLIRYRDTFGGYHETGFCTHYPQLGPIPAESCGFGNWYDKRPKGYIPS